MPQSFSFWRQLHGRDAFPVKSPFLCVAASQLDLVALGRELHFDPVEVSPPEAATLSEELSMEERVQALTDSFYLYGGEQSTDGPNGS